MVLGPRHAHRQPGVPPARRSWPRAIASVLRLLAVLLMFDLSGAVHSLLDAHDFAAGTAHAADDCDDDAPDHECPPGCPNCHCTHAAAPGLAPSMTSAVSFLIPHPITRQFTPSLGMAPAHTDSDTLYRPPRPVTSHQH